jgi:hypothetical protein
MSFWTLPDPSQPFSRRRARSWNPKEWGLSHRQDLRLSGRSDGSEVHILEEVREETTKIPNRGFKILELLDDLVELVYMGLQLSMSGDQLVDKWVLRHGGLLG